ncbi:MAG: phosphatidate cytidylyltransferase [Frankiaceae bacterium]
MSVVETLPALGGALAVTGAAARAAGRRRHPEVWARWLTWAVSAPLVAGALAAGRPGAAALAGALGVVAAVEHGRLTRLPVPDRLLLAAWLAAWPVLLLLAPAAAGHLWLLVPVAAATPALLRGDAADGARRAAWLAFGAVWLGALGWLVPLHAVAWPLVVAVSVADVAAWAGGRLCGGPRLTRVSPGKTVAGLVTGAAAGVGALAALGALRPVLVIAVVVGGPAGDLLESLLKRHAGVKDAGRWLPGFGGLLDRIDSLLVALAVAGALS